MSGPICRIDRMPYASMQKVESYVRDVWNRAKGTQHDETDQVENFIQLTAGEIDDFFGGIVDASYAAIVLHLRELAMISSHGKALDPDEQITYTTGKIIELVQGDNKMESKSQLEAMTFRRVKEAIEKTIDKDSTHDEIVTIAEEYAAKIVNDVFGGKVPATEGEFVPRYYEMDPETEEYLPSGAMLRDGMVVLNADPERRAEIRNKMTEREIYRARTANRWAKIESYRVPSSPLDGVLPSSIKRFVATYEDGTKRRFDAETDQAWLVKKDSIPEEPKLSKKTVTLHAEYGKSDEVSFTIKNAMYEVFNEEGNRVFEGVPGSILEWAAELADDGVNKYGGFIVARSGLVAPVRSLKAFVEENTE